MKNILAYWIFQKHMPSKKIHPPLTSIAGLFTNNLHISTLHIILKQWLTEIIREEEVKELFIDDCN
ncbi:hypothetical protein ABH947_005176 [Bacillus sp. RC206]